MALESSIMAPFIEGSKFQNHVFLAKRMKEYVLRWLYKQNAYPPVIIMLEYSEIMNDINSVNFATWVVG